MNKNVYEGLWMNLLKSKSIYLDEENIALLRDIFKLRIWLDHKNNLFADDL